MGGGGGGQVADEVVAEPANPDSCHVATHKESQNGR